MPTTRSAGNASRMARAWAGERRRFFTVIRLCFSSLGARERWKLEISTVRKGHPAASTSCFSRPRRAPTNRISLSGRRSLTSPARASAGLTCPAVPPQVKTTRISATPLSVLILFFLKKEKDQKKNFARKTSFCLEPV